jgi:SpoVK/Ycf46/Vps4 family AAA+-type ATPase
MIAENCGENAENWNENNIRQVILKDFELALKNVKTSVSPEEIVRYKEWNAIFGSFDIKDEEINN